MMRAPFRLETGLLHPGETCWRAETVGRAAVLLDSSAYFSAALWALQRARRSICLLGWGFDPRTRLRPHSSGEQHGPDEIGNLLLRLSAERPELEIHVLIWTSRSAPPSTSSPTGRGAGSKARGSTSPWTPVCRSAPAITRRCW